MYYEVLHLNVLRVEQRIEIERPDLTVRGNCVIPNESRERGREERLDLIAAAHLKEGPIPR